MNEEELLKERFKAAVSSAVKVISEKFDLEIKFGKNINQKNMDLTVELISIELFKKDQNYEITLLFKNNAFITLTSEIIDVVLEDQKNIYD